MRLFTAISLPDSVTEQIATICHGLRGVRWLSPEQIHLTLNFIGEFPDEQLLDLEEALATIRVPRFPLALSGAGQFASGRDGNVIWIGTSSPEPLFELQKKIQSTLRPFGIKAEKRKYTPHITIARIKSVTRRTIELYMDQFSHFSSEPFTVSEFVLFSSKLRPEGALHSIEALFPLGE